MGVHWPALVGPATCLACQLWEGPARGGMCPSTEHGKQALLVDLRPAG